MEVLSERIFPYLQLAMTSMTFGSVADKGPADSAHSVTSVLSVMSEVRGDWGGVGRVKDTDRVHN